MIESYPIEFWKLSYLPKIFFNVIEKTVRLKAFTCLIFSWWLDYFGSTPRLPIQTNFHLDLLSHQSDDKPIILVDVNVDSVA